MERFFWRVICWIARPPHGRLVEVASYQWMAALLSFH